MRITSRLLFLALLGQASFISGKEEADDLKSPDGKLAVVFWLNEDGAPRYKVGREGREVLRESKLGLWRADADFSEGAVPSVDPEGLSLLIDALGRQDLSAMSWFEEVGPSLRGALGPERFAALDGAIRALQFKRAVEILRGVAFA